MVTATGLGSGLDINALVTAIVDAERVPLTSRIESRKADVNALVSGYGQLQTKLDALRTAVSTIATSTGFSPATGSSSDTSSVGVTVASTAQPSSYEVGVSQLASSQSLVSGTFAATTTSVGSGTLTVAIGTPTYNASPNNTTYASFSQSTSYSISIAANSTLADVQSAINSSSAPVTASLVKSGDGYRLMISGDNSGASNGISLSVSSDADGSDTDNAGLSQLAFNATTTNLSQIAAPQDANFTLNGLALTATSNQISDVVDGLSLDLLSTTSSNAVITVSRDTAEVNKNITAFVTAFNDFQTTQKELTKYDAITGVAGDLQGDAMTRTLVSQLRDKLSSTISGLTGTIDILSEVGISVSSDGSLSIDDDALSLAIASNLDGVQKFFVGETVSGTAISGFAVLIDNLLDSYLDDGGLLPTKLTALDDKLSDIEDDRLLYNQRMEALETRYLRQFNAMDSLLGQLTTTGDMLKSQLDALPGYQNLRQSGNR